MDLLRSMWVVTKKEFRSYFNSPLAYLFINLFLVLNAWLFFETYFLIGKADMRSFFSLLPWMFLFLVPAITMRLWSEEKKLGTVEMLLTMPVSDLSVVLGKFFASFLLLALTLLFSVSIPYVVFLSSTSVSFYEIFVSLFGILFFVGFLTSIGLLLYFEKFCLESFLLLVSCFFLIFFIYSVATTGATVDLGEVSASYIGALLLGMSFLSIGIWFSAMTDNQIISFILTVVICFLFYLMSTDFVLGGLGFFAPIAEFVGLSSHYSSITRGVIDTRDVLYYLSFIGFFLYLNVQSISGRRFQ